MTHTTKQSRRLRQVFLGIVVGTILPMATMPYLQAQSQGSGAVHQEANTAEDLSDRDTLMLVAGVVGLARQGISDPAVTAPVRFATRSAIPRPDPTILDGDFRLVSMTAVRYDKTGDEEGGGTVGGVFLHGDRFGRFISTKYAAYFKVGSEGSIVVHSTTVEPVHPPVPKISIYIVPAVKMTPSDLESRPFVTLLNDVTNNAVRRFETQKGDRGEKDYYVFAFFMNPLAEDAKIGLLISDQPGGLSGDGDDTVSFQENGWHMAYTPARFALDSTPEVFFKVLYTPGNGVRADRREQMVVGVFTSDSLVQQIQRLLAERDYNPGPVDGMMGPSTRKAIRQFQQDQKFTVDGEPSTALLAALNGPNQSSPSVTTAEASVLGSGMVKEIQLGLAQWGYNPGPADGVLGPRTRQAIKEFQQDQGLKVDGKPGPELVAMLTESKHQSSADRNQVRSKAWPNEIQKPE